MIHKTQATGTSDRRSRKGARQRGVTVFCNQPHHLVVSPSFTCVESKDEIMNLNLSDDKLTESYVVHGVEEDDNKEDGELLFPSNPRAGFGIQIQVRTDVPIIQVASVTQTIHGAPSKAPSSSHIYLPTTYVEPDIQTGSPWLSAYSTSGAETKGDNQLEDSKANSSYIAKESELSEPGPMGVIPYVDESPPVVAESKSEHKDDIDEKGKPHDEFSATARSENDYKTDARRRAFSSFDDKPIAAAKARDNK